MRLRAATRKHNVGTVSGTEETIMGKIKGKAHPVEAFGKAGAKAQQNVAKITESGRHADGLGLYLWVLPNGRKTWIWRGTIKGKRTDLGLGNAAKVTVAEARDVCWRYTARSGRVRTRARSGAA